ncbi:MAG: phage holin family protein [Nitriliruptorales bacterium]|nr:phage holin family protein [Nitriliruptorales bacterium]
MEDLKGDPVPTSAGEAARAITDDVRRLVRAEVELAKAEVKGQVAARGVAIGLIAFAVLLDLLVLYWLTAAIHGAWSLAFSSWAAALLTAAVVGGLALVVGGIAMLILRRPMTPPERAQAAAQATGEMVREKLGR